MVPGDVLCAPDTNATTCFADTASRCSARRRLLPKDCHYAGDDPDYSGNCEKFNGSMACEAAPLGYPGCPFAQYNASACECAECLAGAVYACQCNATDGTPEHDGTQACEADGTLGKCECSQLWKAPPSPPPPNPPPAPAPLWPKIVFPVVILGGIAGSGVWWCASGAPPSGSASTRRRSSTPPPRPARGRRGFEYVLQ